LGSGDRRVKVSFEDWELEALHEAARKRGVSLNQLVREAVRRMLEQEREREVVERMEALAEEYMLRTVRAVEPLRDEVGLLREELRAVEGAVARLEEAIGLLREELSELRKRVSIVELGAREGGRRGEGALARRESHREEAEAIAISSDAVAAAPDADFQIPSFIKDNPWVEILSRKGRS
jgi:predicted RNase H-like nuclease (RuvC/YqgF family)